LEALISPFGPLDDLDVLDDNLDMSLKTLEHEVARLPESDREEAEDAVTTVGTVLMRDTSALMHVARLVRPDMVDEEPQSATAQEARNLRRVFALWRRAGDESLTADDLGVSRQQLKHLRDGGKLVALRLPMHREFVYPAWQFASATGQPLDGIPDVLQAADEAKLSPLGLHVLMVSAAAEEGTTPAEWLAAGKQDYVVELVAAANAHAS
jgi:hypothetical protein